MPLVRVETNDEHFGNLRHQVVCRLHLKAARSRVSRSYCPVAWGVIEGVIEAIEARTGCQCRIIAERRPARPLRPGEDLQKRADASRLDQLVKQVRLGRVPPALGEVATR
ncbi:MAG TPA: hypothetical protein VMW48_08450, partial [Vicinamibacterales bacterium]|nr:hypothetical protein [Vicinamibacterales bacterium]